MNKVLSIALFISVLVISSCSVNSVLRTNAKNISGSWQLNTIVSEAINKETIVTLFNEADFRCFIGSSWNFSTDFATYSISSTKDGHCNNVKRSLFWKLFINNQKSRLIQFKKLNDNFQESDPGGIGYLFEVVSKNEKSMQLRSQVMINGQPGVFVFNFIK